MEGRREWTEGGRGVEGGGGGVEGGGEGQLVLRVDWMARVEGVGVGGGDGVGERGHKNAGVVVARECAVALTREAAFTRVQHAHLSDPSVTPLPAPIAKTRTTRVTHRLVSRWLARQEYVLRKALHLPMQSPRVLLGAPQ
jgi:hypothetical protein